MKFGVIPEAMFIGAESLVRMGMGDTLTEASKQAVGFYLDPILGTNFAKEGAFSKMERDVGSEMAFDVSKLNEYKESLAKVQSITNAKNQALAVNDESLTGLTDQEVAAQYDANIAKAQAELNKRMLTETERVDFENKADTAADVAGVNSPIKQAIGKARADTEMMRYENDFTGMQSDMFTQDPMSQKDKTERLSNLLPQKTMRPGLSNFVNFDDRQIEQLSSLTKKPVKELKDYQDYLNKERAMSLLQQEQIYGKEQTYGTQGNFFGEKINEKPMYDYAEGGITGLRSKYEYKK
jgi:phosphopantetheinyl transferase (holo-ACP synthase)